MPGGHRLTDDVPQCGRLHRTGDDEALRGIRRKLIQQSVAGTAPDDVDHRKRKAQEFGQLIRRPAIFHRQTLEDATNDLSVGLRNRLPGIAAERLDAAGHVPRSDKPSISGDDK